MFIIEATRRTKRSYVERIKAAFAEWDRILFKQVTPRPEDCYLVIRDKGTYVLAITDPTIPDPDREQLTDCE
jgi:hypothetical protein